jgi:hypothetical protein
MAERPGFTRKKGLSRQNGQGRAGRHRLPALGATSLQGRVIEREARATLPRGNDRLVDLPADPDHVCASTQGIQ